VFAAENPGDVSEARQAALSFVAGRRVDQLRDLSEEIFDDFDGGTDLVRHTTRSPNCTSTPDSGLAGHRAPVELARSSARRLGPPGAIGTSRRSTRIYTGRLVVT